ncbi:hypothetical protein L9F63_007076, partial [Diploptera punctata]
MKIPRLDENYAEVIAATCRLYCNSTKDIAVFSISGTTSQDLPESINAISTYKNISITAHLPKSCTVSKLINYIDYDNYKNVKVFNDFQSKKYSFRHVNLFVESKYNREKDIVFNNICKKLNLIFEWPIIIKPVTILFGETTEKTIGCYIFILRLENSFVQMSVQLLGVLLSLMNKGLLNGRATYIVLLAGGTATRTLAQRLLQYFAFQEIFNIIVLIQDTFGDFVLYSGTLHTNSKGYCRYIGTPVVLNKWEINKYGGSFVRNKTNFPINSSSFQGCLLIANSRKTLKTNISLELVKDVFKKMNIKIADEMTKAWNDMYTRLIIDPGSFLEIREMHTPLFILPYSWYVRQADAYPRWAGITRVFDTYVWVALTLSIFLTSLIFWILALIFKLKGYDKLLYCMLNSWGVIINIGITIPGKMAMRWFFLSWIIFCMGVNTIFQTFFISYMIDPGRLHQIDTFDEVNYLGYELLSTQIENFFYIFGEKLRPGLKQVLREQDAIILSLYNSKTSLFINEQLLMRSYYELCGNNITYKLHKIRGYESSTYVYVGISNPYVSEKFSQILGIYFQSGIPNLLLNSNCDPKGTLSLTRQGQINLADEYVTMSLSNLQSAFYVFIFMNCFATFIFLCEI